MFRRYLSIIIVSVVATVGVKAQYDPSFSHYFDMEPSYNPASAGKESKLNIVGAYAMSLVGFENNPRTMYIAADMPLYLLNAYHGVGLQLFNDQIGLFTHQKVAAQYSYKLRIFGGQLGIGVQGGFINEQFDGSKVDYIDPDDPALSKSSINGNAFDLAVGLYYTHNQWYVGVSSQHVTSPVVELGDVNELKIDRTYYLTGGYNIKLRNPFLSIPTSFLVKTDGTVYRGDVTARMVYTNEKRILYAGASYSPKTSVTVLIGGSFHGVNVGYSYEAYTSGINMRNGSHELFVGYKTNLNLYKKGKNKHKSVRIL